MLGTLGAVYALAFSPDGATLVTAGASGGTRLWDVAFPAGFVARDMTAQLASAFNVKGGILISEIKPGSSAERAGLKVGDVIVGVSAAADQDLLTCAKLKALMVATRDPFQLKVFRKTEQALVVINN